MLPYSRRIAPIPRWTSPSESLVQSESSMRTIDSTRRRRQRGSNRRCKDFDRTVVMKLVPSDCASPLMWPHCLREVPHVPTIPRLIAVPESHQFAFSEPFFERLLVRIHVRVDESRDADWCRH